MLCLALGHMAKMDCAHAHVCCDYGNREVVKTVLTNFISFFKILLSARMSILLLASVNIRMGVSLCVCMWANLTHLLSVDFAN